MLLPKTTSSGKPISRSIGTHHSLDGPIHGAWKTEWS